MLEKAAKPARNALGRDPPRLKGSSAKVPCNIAASQVPGNARSESFPPEETRGWDGLQHPERPKLERRGERMDLQQ